MSIWGIIILMVVATLCITVGIAFVYSAIVTTVEGYQKRKEERSMKQINELFGKIPEIVEMFMNIEQQNNEKRRKECEEYNRKLAEELKDI